MSLTDALVAAELHRDRCAASLCEAEQQVGEIRAALELQQQRSAVATALQAGKQVIVLKSVAAVLPGPAAQEFTLPVIFTLTMAGHKFGDIDGARVCADAIDQLSWDCEALFPNAVLIAEPEDIVDAVALNDFEDVDDKFFLQGVCYGTARRDVVFLYYSCSSA